jgi:hypothetical protein
MIYIVIILPIVTLVVGFLSGARFGHWLGTRSAIKSVDELIADKQIKIVAGSKAPNEKS